MSLLDIIRSMLKTKKHQPEDDYTTTITNSYVEVAHPKWNGGKVLWSDLHTILLVNTDEGPWLPDVWLTLIGTTGACSIPQGSKGYEEVYAIVSQYEGFNFENVIKSMSCTDNAEFVLWHKSFQPPEPHETKIIGSWTFIDGNVLADEGCKRIEWLVRNYLRLALVMTVGIRYIKTQMIAGIGSLPIHKVKCKVVALQCLSA